MPRPDSTPTRKVPADAAHTPRVPEPADQAAARKAAATAAPPKVDPGEHTKTELDEHARTLGVEGRSKLDKGALAKAVEKAERKLARSPKARTLIALVTTTIEDPDNPGGFRTYGPGDEYQAVDKEQFERQLRLGHARLPDGD